MKAPDLFSKTYAEARERFLGAAQAAGAEIDSQVLPHEGPDEEELAMDFAILGPTDARNGLVIVSGTHGTEGYCGSGCQLGFLNDTELMAQNRENRVVLVHAHNPFGFAWMRRTTEDNIDLNRNYVDYSQPLPGNRGYDELHDAFVPRDLDDPAAAAKLKAYEEEHGKIAFMAAMMGGQRSHADGLFYGGTAPAWSNKTMTAGLQKHLAGQSVVCLVDIHTGLGPYGVPYLVHGYAKDDRRFDVMQNAFGDVMRSIAVKEEFDEELPTDPYGPIVLAMERVLPGKTTYAYVIEYGTFPPEEVLGAHRQDNWLHLYGDLNSEKGKAIKKELRRVMYPEFDDWKEMIWDKAKWAFECSQKTLER